MVNLQESLPGEILRTNKSGAYHCTITVDCNTRKCYGLLVTPVPNLDDENRVLLSSLDETVIQHGAEFNLGLYKYQGNNFSPNGYKYIREFDCKHIPATIYRVGGVVLRKEKIFVHHENRILIRYTLVDVHSATTFWFRPSLAFRNARECMHENAQANRDYQPVENGIKTYMYSGYPEPYMQPNKKNEFHYQPDWYRGIKYPKEQERGYDFNEDLYVSGYLEVDIKKGESIVFSTGVSEISPRKLKQIFGVEVEDCTPRGSFYHCLKNSTYQFHNKQGEEHYILAGYLWLKCRARDLFISLPGLTLTVDERSESEDVMKTAEKVVRDSMEDRPMGYKIYEMEYPDVLLWAVWALQQYAREASRELCRQKYSKLLEDIMNYIRGRKHDNSLLYENGLLYANGKEKVVTWTDSTINRHSVISRTGYTVEVNVLWYNVLRFVANLVREGGDDIFANELGGLAEMVGRPSVEVSRNEHGYLFDYVDGYMMDWSVRSNMIFVVAFDYSPLDRAQREQVLDIMTKELLTPKGLRTLSPKSGEYNPNYIDPQVQRGHAYHQGTARPWLMGFYMEAYLCICKMSGISFMERYSIGFEDEMTSHRIGLLPELFGGNPPFKGRGAVSFAMSMAEILRILKLSSKYDLQEEE